MSNTQLIVTGVCVLMVVIVVAMRMRAGASQISGTEARDLVSQGALLLDVRSPQEFASGHIQGAKNIAVQELSGRLGELKDTNQVIVVYCRSGQRSGSASRLMRQRGYEHVHDLGAMSNW